MGHDMFLCEKCGGYDFIPIEKCVCELPSNYALDILRVKDGDILSLANEIVVRVDTRVSGCPWLWILTPNVGYTHVTEYQIAKVPSFKVIKINETAVNYNQSTAEWRIR